PSVGGLATGMKSIYKNYESLWMGWPGIDKKEVNEKNHKELDHIMKKENCYPVYLNEEDIDLYYHGFSNKTIWPLFHYFNQFVEYNQEYWDAYEKVNQIFAEAIIEQAREGDYIWIHDYHLMLLPKLVKEKIPAARIGFFLHIPFPSYEVFRIIPWRKEILEGLLGADLIGFHTFDYERHFISATRRLLGHNIVFDQVHLSNRIVKLDAFPMGIDYDKYFSTSIAQKQKSINERSTIQKEIEKYYLLSPDRKLILSIDRLDYSKGISNRLIAFEHFLDIFPEFHQQVTLVLLAVPSRINVEQYQVMKKEIDELVGRINGKYASINWTPIWYFYRALPFESLIDLYNSSEVALITPVRDGMNLVAKEYVACRTNQKGVLILSEMAGAAKELSEAIIINPHNKVQIANALKQAIMMKEDEQINRNIVMQERIRRYDIKKWAKDFISRLEETEALGKKFVSRFINKEIMKDLVNQYHDAENSIFFLDYDGTLVKNNLSNHEARPSEELYRLLDQLAGDKKTRIVIESSRDKSTIDEWFGKKDYTLMVEHGLWIKEPGENWRKSLDEEYLNNEWKKTVVHSMESYVDRTPGTFVEEKEYSLAWNYRKADHELGEMRARELKDDLTNMIANLNLDLIEENKTIEIKHGLINKGKLAADILKSGNKYDFILAIGDDWTDEHLFEEIPASSITIKVGMSNSIASYYLETNENVQKFLEILYREKIGVPG
ncbi:MAG: bifunctional alpha,alpha-trehalose-phosphate synthase (UDP-forming)/trehalose-phosphatase, partial [Bacteroidota bacterium]